MHHIRACSRVRLLLTLAVLFAAESGTTARVFWELVEPKPAKTAATQRSDAQESPEIDSKEQSQPPWPLSSVECAGDDPRRRVCRLFNVTLWGGKLHLLSEGGVVHDVPGVRLHFRDDDDRRGEPPLDHQQNVGKFIVSADVWNSPIPAVNYKLAKRALVAQRSHVRNLWHSMGEDSADLYVRACRYLGSCKYDEQAAERKELLLLWTDDQSERLQLPAISELWNCFAERQMKIADAAAHEAIVISELVIGVGPICKARDCNSDNGLPGHKGQAGMRDLSAAEKQGWIRYLRQCAALNATSLPPPDVSKPRVSIVNRAHAAGRSIVTAAEALARMRAADPADNAQLMYMEGKSFKEQARLLDQTDVLVAGHGAVIAMFVFLPTCSIVVEISSQKSHQSMNTFAATTLTPLSLQTFSVKLINPQEVSLNLGVLSDDTDFPKWSDQDKLSLLWKLQCPPVHPFCVDVNFWSHALEYAPDPGTLVQTMNKAKSLWVEGQRTCNAEV